MKIIPEANNHVKLELNMNANTPKRWLDVNEGAGGGRRLVNIHMEEPLKNPMEPFEITFVTEDGELKTFVVTNVEISTRREK